MVGRNLDISRFQNEDSWIGGYYELAFEFHPTGGTKRLMNALKTLCEFDEINELYESKERKVQFFQVPLRKKIHLIYIQQLIYLMGILLVL